MKYGMNERVEKLRSQSVNTKPKISMERARIVTDMYKKYEGKVSSVRLRAMTYRELMKKKTIYIGDGELIVGERGPSPQVVPTYPELCAYTREDLEVINDRKNVFFKVDEEEKEDYLKNIKPYWENKSIRDVVFDTVSNEWIDCYYAGVFTEFMEQRAPGHTVADEKVFFNGFSDFSKQIDDEIAKLPVKEGSQFEQLQAMKICCEGIVIFAHRHRDLALEMAEKEENLERKEELEAIADRCNHVPEFAPRNFADALQIYWFVHLSVITELNTWDSFCPGRLDQHLFPYYKEGLENNTLDKYKAKEFLECFWIKFNNQPSPPKVGVTMEESSTYTDFCNINIGGVTKEGEDGVNEVSYLLLDIIKEMKILQPSTNVQVSEKNPDKFILEAAKVIKEGMGFPSVFNADAVVKELVWQGKSLEDARCGGASGCVEVGAFGKESYILTGYFNLVKVLELTLHNGIDPKSGKQLGIKTGEAKDFKTYEELMIAFEKQVNYFADIKIAANVAIEKIYSERMQAPFMSVVIDDCITAGKDYNDGGARYNQRYIQMVGIGSISDSISGIKKMVFDDKKINMADLISILDANFEGYEKERLTLVNKIPKYGNDDDYADDIMKDVFDIAFKAVNGRSTYCGGVHRIEMLPTTCHVYFGSVIGATPDGRYAGKPLSEGISPAQGADRKGPTAVIKSASKMDHLKTGGTLLNQKFSPELLADDEGLHNLKNLVRAYFKLDGHHVQFNIVNRDTLLLAQKSPEEYSNLIVRVAGYSDYFGNLNKSLQDEIIGRTENYSF